jgi:hypothetical protein
MSRQNTSKFSIANDKTLPGPSYSRNSQNLWMDFKNYNDLKQLKALKEEKEIQLTTMKNLTSFTRKQLEDKATPLTKKDIKEFKFLVDKRNNLSREVKLVENWIQDKINKNVRARLHYAK